MTENNSWPSDSSGTRLGVPGNRAMQSQAPPIREYNPWKTAFIVTLVSVLVLGGGLGIWWFMFRNDGAPTNPSPEPSSLVSESSVQPARLGEVLSGLKEKPQIAWKYSPEHSSGIEIDLVAASRSDGLLALTQETSIINGNAELAFIDWETGTVKWSVELTSRLREKNYKIISGTDAIKSNLPGDMIGVMVETDKSGYETHNRMLLYRGSNGEFVREISLGKGSLYVADSGAVYLVEPIGPGQSSDAGIKVSRAASIDKLDEVQWTREIPEAKNIPSSGPEEVVLERDGYADFCNFSGATVQRCTLSLAIKDGTEAIWSKHQEASYSFRRIDGVVIDSTPGNSYQSTVTGYSPDGKKLWTRQADNFISNTAFIVDDVFFAFGSNDQVERVDPKTGKTIWKQNWCDGGPAFMKKDTKMIVTCGESNFQAGIADIDTGNIILQEYNLAEAVNRKVFMTTDGIVVDINDQLGQGVRLTAIDPSKPGILWTESYEENGDGNDDVDVLQIGEHLLLETSDSIALLR